MLPYSATLIRLAAAKEPLSDMGLPAKDCAASASADVRIEAAGVRVSSLGAPKAALFCIAVPSATESSGFTAVVHEIG